MTASHPLLTNERVAAYVSSVYRRMGDDESLPPDSLSDYVLGASAEDGLRLAVQLALLVGDDEDVLCWMAVDIVEPLIDLHWAEIAAPLEVEARRSAPLRKVLSCCDFDASVPAGVRRRLGPLVGPGEDILHSSAPATTTLEAPRPTPVHSASSDRERTAFAGHVTRAKPIVPRRKRFALGIAGVAVALGLAGAGVAVGGAIDGDDANVTGPEADRAVAAAVEAAGGGTPSSVEHDTEGAAVWQVEITKADGTIVEIRVDGSNTVVVVEPDSPESDDEQEPDDHDDLDASPTTDPAPG